ncbi:DUF6544 family protein [Falsiroseomonas sp.]|uniref:DUF6544 family protein n=1 Tax=Falsiroseomonas sp. TaxID=2870721 RepID=UPI0035665057
MPIPLLPALLGGALGAGALAAAALRRTDARRAAAAWAHLAALAEPAPPRFDPAMVEGLPAPARRWLTRAIAPGTPLSRIAEIEMEGELGLGDRTAPRYQPMRARQILAPPHGFVWIPRLGAWPARILGSDGLARGDAWVRFWLAGLVPVARAADTPDLARSAMARCVAEAALWVPAALLPGPGLAWQAMDEHRARLRVDHAGQAVAVEIEVADDGRLLALAMQRWSDANPARVFRLQPFGGRVLEEARVGGFTVAGRVEAGNHFGTPDYFPFFRARIIGIRYR